MARNVPLDRQAPLRQTVRNLAFILGHTEIPIKPSAFGHLAPAMGAALVLQRFLENGETRRWSPPISTLETRPIIGAPSMSRRT